MVHEAFSRAVTTAEMDSSPDINEVLADFHLYACTDRRQPHYFAQRATQFESKDYPPLSLFILHATDTN